MIDETRRMRWSFDRGLKNYVKTVEPARLDALARDLEKAYAGEGSCVDEFRAGSGSYPSSSFGFPTRVHLSSGGVMRVVTSTMMTTAE